MAHNMPRDSRKVPECDHLVAAIMKQLFALGGAALAGEIGATPSPEEIETKEEAFLATYKQVTEYAPVIDGIRQNELEKSEGVQRSASTLASPDACAEPFRSWYPGFRPKPENEIKQAA
jgi:hypothetical protein